MRSLVMVLVMATTAHADPAPAKQPLVIEFGATWCGPCQAFDENVMTSLVVKQALEGIRFVRYDVDESPGLEAADKYRIDAYPTFLSRGTGRASCVVRAGARYERREARADARSTACWL